MQVAELRRRAGGAERGPACGRRLDSGKKRGKLRGAQAEPHGGPRLGPFCRVQES